MAINKKPTGIIDCANHLGIKGAISIGYWYSTLINSQLPYAKAIKTKKLTSLGKKVRNEIFFSLLNNEDLFNDRSLFWFDAIIAPTKPIHSVKCWTITCDAVILLKGNILENVSKKGITAINEKIIIDKIFIQILG